MVCISGVFWQSRSHIYVTGYSKTDHNVTFGQLLFIGSANSHTHTLPMHCCINGLSLYSCRTDAGNVQEMSPTCRFLHQVIPTFPVLRKCAYATHQISCLQEMCMKCHLSCFQIFSFMPENTYRKCEGNMLEMSCVLTTGNMPEISCVLVQEMCLKFCPILHQEKLRKCQNFLV